MSDVCKYCKHCKPCKVLTDKRWVWFKICTVFLDGTKGEKALVIEDDDRCEMFSPKTYIEGVLKNDEE